MKQSRTLLLLVASATVMLGVAYASVPLYRLFCSATGYGGTTQRVTEAEAEAPQKASDRWVTVSFDGNVDRALPWDFGPDSRSIRIKVGAITLITYHARNRSNQAIVGHATFNVQPDRAGTSFDKVQCFCFTQQTLQPGEAVHMPVQFYISPDLPDDVHDITLSYTFFRAKDQAVAQASLER